MFAVSINSVTDMKPLLIIKIIVGNTQKQEKRDFAFKKDQTRNNFKAQH